MASGGKRKNAGRKPGSLTEKTRGIAEQAAREGVTPLEVMLGAMRLLWSAAIVDGVLTDHEKLKEASMIAKDAAPFIHPRLSNVEANVTVSDHEAALAALK